MFIHLFYKKDTMHRNDTKGKWEAPKGKEIYFPLYSFLHILIILMMSRITFISKLKLINTF